VKKSRFLYLDPKVNPRKIASLEALQAAYATYLQVCVNAMLQAHKFSLALKDKQAFFPACETLSSQIIKNVRDHAISIVSGWAASKYTTKLRGLIKGKFIAGEVNEATRSALYILGKRLVDKPSGKVTQEALDLYWSWLLDENIVGRTPGISSRCGMRMSEMTCVLSMSTETTLSQWWIAFSHLQAGKARIQLPLAASPYVKDVADVSKGVLARRTKQGRWRFEVVEKAEWNVPEPAEGAPRIGVDVGLNVMAATSDGELLGASLKPKFNALYAKVKAVRANRQRQGFKENSQRLDVLEAKLTGMVKTMAGEVSNALVEAHTGAVFVVEDLDLRGCRGSKRFAYRALHHSLETKAACEVVNPAYSSQTCPSCGYVSRKNRQGIKFHCRACGRLSHADVVGGINLLGRSEDQQVGLDDHPSAVKTVLRRRFAEKRRSPVGLSTTSALAPSSRRLTTRAPCGSGTASNRVEAHDQV
jgi:Putative transposase DNA-binding domain